MKKDSFIVSLSTCTASFRWSSSQFSRLLLCLAVHLHDLPLLVHFEMWRERFIQKVYTPSSSHKDSLLLCLAVHLNDLLLQVDFGMWRAGMSSPS